MIDLKQELFKYEKLLIEEAFSVSKNVTQAANYLNIKRTALIFKMKKFGLVFDYRSKL